MKNKMREYIGLNEEEKKYLREFDNAVERGIFKDNLVKIPKDMKKKIEREREKFRADLMYKSKRKTGDVGDMEIKEKVAIGKKKGHDIRDKKGQFTKKENK